MANYVSYISSLPYPLIATNPCRNLEEDNGLAEGRELGGGGGGEVLE